MTRLLRLFLLRARTYRDMRREGYSRQNALGLAFDAEFDDGRLH